MRRDNETVRIQLIGKEAELSAVQLELQQLQAALVDAQVQAAQRRCVMCV